MNGRNETVTAYLKTLSDLRFWGAVTLKYESGKVVHLRKEENLKLSDLSGTPERMNVGTAR
jgi:hypothetical protein